MIKWAIVFFCISIIAGIFGFTGVAAGSAAIAKVLFTIALVLFLVFLIAAFTLGKTIANRT